jgi:twitching motility protein PilT
VTELRSSHTSSQILRSAAGRQLDEILTYAVKLGASDVHLHSGAPIQFRINGQLLAHKGTPIEAARMESLLVESLSDRDRERLQAHNDLDFAHSIPGLGRFRGNIYRQQRGLDAVFRVIPPAPPTLEELGLPASLTRLTNYHQGLVLLTGPAGCGKSSTLAALVRLINEDRKDHIITVEDPIEYMHQSQKCVVNQRQVIRHTESFASALRAALREDPDVIAIGELRDLETMSLAITAAETGHLVLATLHTNNAVRTINRILDVFPVGQQSQVRAMVSESLRAVVSQRLVPTADGKRRVPALEILFVNLPVSNLIREDKTFQIRSVLQTGKIHGMCLLDDSLAALVASGVITKETARQHSEDPRQFS